MIQILLGDDNDLALLGARLILENGHHAFHITAAVDTLSDGLVALQHQSPDVAFLSERLDPETAVVQLVERVRSVAPAVKLLILGTVLDGLLLRDLFTLGVNGYLYRADRLQDCLIPAVTTVMRQRPYLSPTANAEYLIAMQSPQRDWHLDAEARQVLHLLAQGRPIPAIAIQMGVPLRRIYWVRQKLRKRFGANTNEHLISLAVAEGFAYTTG
ncbi:MAG TPA: hypothetical protein VHO69_09450 [Phototrophicaceae bacterium]|nr:hypothetical protein [Phototrophicaceae bacterium]